MKLHYVNFVTINVDLLIQCSKLPLLQRNNSILVKAYTDDLFAYSDAI